MPSVVHGHAAEADRGGAGAKRFGHMAERAGTPDRDDRDVNGAGDLFDQWDVVAVPRAVAIDAGEQDLSCAGLLGGDGQRDWFPLGHLATAVGHDPGPAETPFDVD